MKSMKKYLKYYLCFIVAFLFLMAVPVSAQAANYQLVDVSTGHNGVKTKVGSYYFWSQYKEGKGNQIFSSKSSKAKTGNLIAVPKQSESVNWILTNGSKVYYINDDSNTKHSLYEVSAIGKNRKKITSLTGNRIVLYNYYNNRIYYRRYTNSGPNLCCISLNTKKSQTLLKNAYVDYTNGAGRYVCVDTTKSSGKSEILSIYDCKKSKVIKKHTIKKSSNEYGSILVVTKNYCYIKIESEKAVKIYRCAKNGSGSMKLVKQIDIDTKHDGCVYVEGADDKYIYYYTSDSEAGSAYCRLKVSSGKVSKISESAYKKATEKLQ